LAGAPRVLRTESLRKPSCDGRSGEHALGLAEGVAASACVNDPQPGIDRAG